MIYIAEIMLKVALNTLTLSLVFTTTDAETANYKNKNDKIQWDQSNWAGYICNSTDLLLRDIKHLSAETIISDVFSYSENV